MILGIEQKKGSDQHLDGRVTVYAYIDIDPSDLITMKHPIASMIHNGYLVAQGNFREQSNLRDFLKSEMGISLDEGLGEGLAQLLEKMDGLESALDPQKLKDRLENMDEFEDFIPTPAKIVPFHSEDEILNQEGDVFFAGTFRNIGNAVLSINSLPIFYQARYREQEIHHVRNEIENLIAQIEQNGVTKKDAIADSAEQKILKEYIPNMLYSRKENKIFTTAVGQFKDFMKGYQFQEDVTSIIDIIGRPNELTNDEFKVLELYAKKISSVFREDYKAADQYMNEIRRLRH